MNGFWSGLYNSPVCGRGHRRTLHNTRQVSGSAQIHFPKKWRQAAVVSDSVEKGRAEQGFPPTLRAPQLTLHYPLQAKP